MSWRIRHEGSPVSIDDLSLPEIVEGLQDGHWEPTDEVMGPGDQEWVAIENHPELAEAAADIEPRPPHHYDDETRLDFNALIDVTLVLLIFFILTTSYAALQKVLQAADVAIDKELGVPVVTQKQVKEFMIKVDVKMQDGKPVIRVEDQVVDEDSLMSALRNYMRGEHRKTDLLLISDPDVPRATVVLIQDKARGAQVNKVYRLVQRDKS
jgi:biopolymer transport protein ExbD